MKKLLITLLFLSPIFASAQTTGQFIPFLRWTNATGTQATTTSFFTTKGTLTTICLTGDICRTTWPSVAGSATTTLLQDNNHFSGSNIFDLIALSTTTSATTTNLFSTTASSSKLFAGNFQGAGLVSCNSTNALGWSGGLFSCVAIPQGTVTSVTGTASRITSTGGATPAIDISASYVGQSSITTVGTLSAGAVPTSLITGGAALTKTDDTNVTLTLGGSPSTSLLAATSLTLGWTGTLADARVADNLTISGGTVDNSAIGASTPLTAVFTNATSSNASFTKASTTQLWLSGTGYTTTNCLQVSTAGLVSGTGSACGAGGGGGAGNSKFATTTNGTGIVPNGGVGTFLGIATTTDPKSPLTVATTTLTSAAFPIGISIGPNGLTSGSAAGTIIGSNTQAGFAGDFLQFQVNGSSKFNVGSDGSLSSGGSISASNSFTTGSGGSFIFPSASRLKSSANGLIELFNNAANGFTRLNFGGTTSASIGLGNSGQKLSVQLADGTNGGYFGVGTSTPMWTAQFASSTNSQLTLSDPSSVNNAHWSFRNAGGNFYLATSSASTFATSSVSALTIDTNGNLSLMNTGSNIQVGGMNASSTLTLTAEGGRAMTTQTVPGPVSNPTTLLFTTNNINVNVLDYASTTSTTTCAYWNARMPDNYDGGAIAARVHWTATSSSGTVAWGIRALSIGDGEAIDTAPSATTTITDTLLSANQEHISAYSSAFLPTGSPAAGESTYFRVCRNAAVGSGDNFGVSARLLKVDIKYAKNKFSE